ncbi:uncharacterized protein LOC126692751 isoform X3 [Quercus robur]|uniref:uncharacterized protein LOC126692751 isoform X3 n=1 Tax=Quercus robur TaxID=38942 RepID=UPI0021625615|nr:uncharacterized protein LOC126692751 isoform X3 [Quercus robur]
MVVSDANLVLYVEEQFNPSPRYLDSSLGGLYSISLEISQMSKFCLNGDSIFVVISKKEGLCSFRLHVQLVMHYELRKIKL